MFFAESSVDSGFLSGFSKNFCIICWLSLLGSVACDRDRPGAKAELDNIPEMLAPASSQDLSAVSQKESQDFCNSQDLAWLPLGKESMRVPLCRGRLVEWGCCNEQLREFFPKDDELLQVLSAYEDNATQLYNCSVEADQLVLHFLSFPEPDKIRYESYRLSASRVPAKLIPNPPTALCPRVPPILAP